MLKRLLTFATGLALVCASPTLAQDRGTPAPEAGTERLQTSVTNQAEERNARNQRDNRRQQRAQRGPTPEQIKTRATALAATLQPGCQVTEAIMRGRSARGQDIYEAACATGPGYILITAAEAVANPAAPALPATAADCVDLFGQADLARQRDPAADVGLQCTIPDNMNVLRVVTAYAVAAGVTCTLDQGSATGVRNGQTVYEVGCEGLDGYWVERQGEGWTATPCLQITSTNGTCRYTTASEQAASLKGWLVGSEGASCDVTQARYMGANANGSFFEAKCNEADGLIVRFNTEKAVQQIYPCATAQRIGGGCKLTEAPALSEPAAVPAPATRR